MSLEELEKRVRRIEDILEIQKLQAHYVDSLTLTDWPEVYACFSDNAVVRLKNTARGKQEIIALFQADVCHKHVGLEGNFVVHPMITVEGDTAKGGWLLYMQFARPDDLPPEVAATISGATLDWVQGFYEMEYVRENDEWKISMLRWKRRLASRRSGA